MIEDAVMDPQSVLAAMVTPATAPGDGRSRTDGAAPEGPPLPLHLIVGPARRAVAPADSGAGVSPTVPGSRAGS
jgi:hypothetical protein